MPLLQTLFSYPYAHQKLLQHLLSQSCGHLNLNDHFPSRPSGHQNSFHCSLHSSWNDSLLYSTVLLFHPVTAFPTPHPTRH
jgi:hypothetical protein